VEPVEATAGTVEAKKEKKDTRERIIPAAAELFYRQGYQGTSLDQVAQAAGVNRGSLYYFFKSKKNLALAVIGHYERLLHHHYLEPALGGGGGRAGLAALAERYARMPSASSPCCGCPIGNLSLELSGLDEELRERLKEVWEGIFARIAEAIRRAQKEGALDPGAEAAGLARAFFASIQGAHIIARSVLDEEALRRDCRRAFESLPWIS